ncbi:MAG: hypothetical protein K2H23_00300, partial [Oscillospiraceae bacterium]|nr:hypothetical protein [Oscillospiraceae bacterium]
MNEQVQKVTKVFTQFWESQDKKRRILYISLVAAIILIAVVVTIILNRKDYVVLYENLETTEASQMVTLIEEMGYDAVLSGGTISVPMGTENQIAMQLAMQNYPKSGLNYQLTTSAADMFSTESEKRAYARIDMENRLSAIFSSMENISSSVVTLHIPETRNTVVVTSLQDYAMASVYVTLKDIDKLSNEQITGIKNIVRTSCKIDDEHIEIVDSYGIPQLITDEDNFDLIVDITKKLAYKTNLENTIKNKVLELLMPAYGDDGVSVAVNMNLNFDSKVSETTDYSADGNNNTGVLAHADGKDASGGTTVDGGIVGVETNADDTFPTADTAGNDRWTDNSFSNTYLVDTYKEQVEKDGYVIEGLSIAVVLYTDYISDAQRQDLVRLVGNAGSVNPEIVTDVVSVTNLPKYVDPSTITTPEPTYLFGLTFDQLILVGAIVIILILVILIALAIVSGNAKKKRLAFEQQIIETSGLVGPDGETEEPVDMFL